MITKIAVLIAALFCSLSALAVEVTELQGSAHGFPTFFDANGKKLGDGDFSQWIEDERLHIKIIYKFERAHRIEERALFHQGRELIQEEWSWREFEDGKLQREYVVDFKSQIATAQKREEDELKSRSEKIEVQPGQTFAGFGFTLALQNLRKRLINGEHIELQAVGFSPKARVVAVDLSHGGASEMKMSDRMLQGDRFVIHPKIPAIAKLFVQVPDTQIWLTKFPAGFLRWEGPVAEPNEPIVRVDLIPGAQSGPAKPVQDSERK